MRPRSPSPIERLIGHLSRYPFWYASLAAHVLLYFAIQWLFPSTQGLVVTPEQRARVDESLQRTTTSEMQKHVKNLETMKKLIEEAAGIQSPKAQTDNPPEPKSAAELLARTEQLSREIKEVAQKDKAKKLAELLKIPEKEALEKVKEEAKKAAANDPKTQTPEQRTAELVEQSKRVLKEKREQLARADEGVGLQQEPAGATGVNGAGKGQHAGNGDGIGNGYGNDSGVDGGSARDKIGEFLDAQLPLPALLNTGSGNYDLGERGDGRVHDLGSQRLVKLGGMSLGAGGDFTNRFVISSWYIIGPFDGVRNRNYAKNPQYPPEQAVVLDAVYQGKDKRMVGWEYTSSPKYPVVPGNLVEDSVYYGYTEIHVDADREVGASIGADDDVRIWLNDQLVYSGNTNDKMWFFDQVHNRRGRMISQWNLTEAKRRLRLKKGVNKLLFKLSNGPEYGFFSLVLTPD